MTQTLSAQGFDLLGQREDKRNRAYRDSVGIWTIGIGHTGPEVHEGLVWTDAQVMDAFAKDAAWVSAAIVESVKVPLEQYQYDALFSFTFNVGANGEEHSHVVSFINAGDMAGAATAFDMWHIPASITTRRNGEKFQFMGIVFAARCDANGNPVP